MTTAIVGLLSAVVGLVIGSGYSFWSTRRSELAAAVVACSTLSEELRQLGEDATPTRLSRFLECWDENRDALICEMGPADYTRLADAVRGASKEPARRAEDLRATMAALADLYWKEHQAFILVPLVNYARRNPLSRRLRASLDRTLPK